ncbi:hypothetical protein CK203_065939 [Vitis vinifera]|uniref:Putative plant transposon protein domain-containing protein n=1 Tax=Vitis vinifera TaxID=29760 RepID=A0A438FPJ5_VITVI|nr:hypothetical protein CK203_065939 [Vitis vinifera]
MSQFQIPRPTYTPSSISKASESIFQDTIDGSMSHLGASASTLQARIPPTYVSPSISKVHENNFQDPIDGLMSQLGASTSTSNFLLPLPSASPSMYQLRAPSPTPQFQISPAYTPMQLPHFLQQTMVRNQIVQIPQNQQVGVLNNSSMGQFGHDASYGIQQQYSTPTLANHENNQNRQDGVMSTFQFNTNMGKVNEFNISINHYPSLNSNVGCFMAPRRARGASKALGKRPAQPSQDGEAEARRKARFDTGLFTSVDEYQRYKQHFVQRKVVAGRNINFAHLQHFGFESLFARMGWLPLVTISEPIFPTLVRAFYSRVTFGHGGPITSTVRGVQIHLDPESICRILDIPPGGLRVYDAKAWPTVPGFDPREAIQRMCGLADAPGLGKPSAHSLTVTCRVLHHMIAYILLPRGGHRDEVSYLEAFLIDSIMTGRRIDVGYVMMMHMMACCERPKRILPYGRFMTRVFKDAGVDLSREQEVEGPSSYDTYDEQSMARMKLEKAPDGSWIRRADRPVPHPQAEEDEEEEIGEMEGGSEGGHIDPTISDAVMTETGYTAGPSGQPSFTEPHYTHTSPGQAPDAAEHAPWMELSAQITSLGTRIEERMDQHQATHEHILQRLDRQERQHEELMAYLRAVFPPPPAAP